MSQTRKKIVPAFLAASALAAPPLYAANDAMMELLKVLKEKGTLDEASYEAIVSAAKADDEHVQYAEEQIKKAEKESPKIDTNEKIKISSADGDFTWQFIGRIMADYYVADSDITQLATESSIRRARLGMEGTAWKHWVYKLEYDFAAGEADLKDGYIGFKDDYGSKAEWWARAGQTYIPFGLATMSSSKYMLFLERCFSRHVKSEPRSSSTAAKAGSSGPSRRAYLADRH